jgi:WD40 repeat protein
VWNVDKTPRPLRRFVGLRSTNGQPESVETVAFSPDGRYLAAGDVNHTPGAAQYRLGAVALWELDTGRLRWIVRNRGGWVHQLAFSPDGGTIAAAQEDGRVRLYQASSGKLDRTLTLYGGARENAFTYDTLAFGPRGLLATGTWAGITQLWDARTGRHLTLPRLVAAAPVSSLAFEASGRLLASVGGSDGTLKLWRAPDLTSFGADFPLEATQWGSAAFTPDGSRIVALFGDGHGVVWPATSAAWLRHACAVAGRNLTRDEWARYIGSPRYEKTCVA